MCLHTEIFKFKQKTKKYIGYYCIWAEYILICVAGTHVFCMFTTLFCCIMIYLFVSAYSLFHYYKLAFLIFFLDVSADS